MGEDLVLPLWREAFAVMIPSLLFYGVWVLATKAVTKDDLRLIARMPMPGWLLRAAGRFIGKQIAIKKSSRYC